MFIYYLRDEISGFSSSGCFSYKITFNRDKYHNFVLIFTRDEIKGVNYSLKAHSLITWRMCVCVIDGMRSSMIELIKTKKINKLTN